MRVIQLATSLGVTADTVRFYTREGFLKPEKCPTNGYKEYGQQDRSRLRFILSARQLGFSVDDIGQILQQADEGETPCPTVRRTIERRLEDVERRFRDIALLKERMHAAIEDWNVKPDRSPTGQMICHLIENFPTEEQQ